MVVIRPSKKTLRGGNLYRSTKPGDWPHLKMEESQMEATDRESAASNPGEFEERLRDPATGEEAYTSRQQRVDEDLRRAKLKGRSRIPGKQGLQFKRGGKVNGRDYGK
jgi:hypothetical protein